MEKSKTKIIGTLGPSTSSFEMIYKMIESGVQIFRLNFSHGDYDFHLNLYKNILKAKKINNSEVKIMIDFQGPKLRIGDFLDGKIFLNSGDIFQLDSFNSKGDSSRVFFPHEKIFECISVDEEIFLDDGKIKLKVKEISKGKIITEVLSGGSLSNKKGFNVPFSYLKISAITDKDLSDIKFVNKEMKIDFAAISFVQSAEDIISAKKLFPNQTKIIAKIEKPLAVKNIDDILDVSSGIMVARGDLAVEMGFEKVPEAQKNIILKTNLKNKFSIVATQMLESMIESTTPTRAEVSDVANAIYDGADAVMLSAETASGKNSIEAIKMMKKIIVETEESKFYQNYSTKRKNLFL